MIVTDGSPSARPTTGRTRSPSMPPGTSGRRWSTRAASFGCGLGVVETIDLGAPESRPSRMTVTAARRPLVHVEQRGALARVDLAGDVIVHELPDPTCGPVGITARPDGLWFVEILAGRAGHLDRGRTSPSSTCPTARASRTRSSPPTTAACSASGAAARWSGSIRDGRATLHDLLEPDDHPARTGGAPRRGVGRPRQRRPRRPLALSIVSGLRHRPHEPVDGDLGVTVECLG